MGGGPGRIYPDYHTMLEEEAKRTGEDRLDFVVVATPNNTHYEIVKDIIAHGFHIVCDKPVTFTSRGRRAEGPGPGKRSSVRRVLQLCPLRHSGAGQKDDR